MKAIATEDFMGVHDDSPRTVQIRKGDELHGDLARMAVAGGQAQEVKDGKAAPENKADEAAPEKKARKTKK